MSTSTTDLPPLPPPPPRYSQIPIHPLLQRPSYFSETQEFAEKSAGKQDNKTNERGINFDVEEAPNPSSFAAEFTESIRRGPFFRRTVLRIANWGLKWGPMVLLVTYFVGSVFLYVVLPMEVLEIFWYFYMVSNFYIAFNTIVEACLSLTPNAHARRAIEKIKEKSWNFPTKDEELPVIDIIIVAYLPNEKDIIIDRTIYAVEQIIYPPEKLRINIMYNTPKPMPELEARLHNLTPSYPNLRIIKVPNSTSKADNINYFLCLDIQTDIVAIFDCDHYPHPYGPRWAAERFCESKNVGVVQGRCVVFNASTSFLTSIIAVEFDKIYAVSHPGRASMWDFGLFCGSNGYWKVDILRDIGMDNSMLTEDIDSALRALGKNVNVVHELNAVSYELAPATYKSLAKQRLRWAQGWTQVSIKHVVLAWKQPEEGNRKFSVRAGLVSLLLIRELSYYLVTQYACLIINFIIVRFPKTVPALVRLIFFQFPMSEWFFIISIICFIATLEITNHVRSEFASLKMVIQFTAVYPLYLMVNASIGLYGHARQLMGHSSWDATART